MPRKSQEVSLKLAELLGYEVVQTLPVRVRKPGEDEPVYWNPYHDHDDALEAVAKISGRSIRQMLRLSKFVADKMFGGRVTLKSLQFASKFHHFSDEEMVRDEEIEDVKAFR